MPYIRIEKCVYKKTKKGKRGEKKGCSDSVAKAKKYLKALSIHSDDLNEEEKSNFILDAVNEVVGSLPIGHKNRNKTFALEIMQKTIEELKNLEIVSRHEVLRVAKKLSGNLELL